MCISNDTLSDRDQATVRTLLLEAQEDTHSIRAASRLPAIPEPLMQRLKSTATRVQILSMGIVPHKVLPSEILALIFFYSLYNRRTVVPPIKRMAPWNLVQVCSRWRAVARAVPQLWASIDVLKHSHPFKASTTAALTDIFSRCGGEGNITLQIQPTCESDWEHTLSLISTHSSRLLGLHLVLNESCIKHLSAPLPALENLRYLHISCRAFISLRGWAESPALHISAFSDARNLSAMSILHAPERLLHTAVIVTPSQLTVLTLSEVSASTLLRVLVGCPLLTNVHIGMANSKNVYAGRVVSMKHLESIFISPPMGVDTGSFEAVFLNLTLPVIKNLHIGLAFSHGMTEQSIIPLLESCGVSVTSLSLTISEFLGVEQFVRINENLPPLTIRC